MYTYLKGLGIGLFTIALILSVNFGLLDLNSKTTSLFLNVKSFRPSTLYVQYQSDVDHQPKMVSYPILPQQIALPLQIEMKDFDDTQYIRIYLDQHPMTIFIESIYFSTFSFSKINYFGNWTPSQSTNTMMTQCHHCSIADSTTQYIQIESQDSSSYMEINLDSFKGVKQYFKINNHEKIKVYFAALILSIFIIRSLKSYSSGSRMDFRYFKFTSLSPVVLSFAFILLSCFLNSIFHFIPDLSSKENRRLTPVPGLKLNSFYQLPDALDNYCKDHFAFRNVFLFVNSMMRLNILHESSLPKKVIAGHHGFFFYYQENMENYRKLSKIDTTRDAAVLNKFENYLKWLGTKQCKFYILLPPDKEQIYSDHMPSQYSNKEGYGYNVRKYYLELLKKGGSLNVIDPTDSLLSGTKIQDVYFNTDTHWNFWGAFKAYQALFTEIKKSFPDMNVIREEDIEMKESYSSYGDLSTMLGINQWEKRKEVQLFFKDSIHYFDYNYSATIETIFRQNKTSGSKRHKLIYFGDSFAFSLMPFLNKHFNESIYLRHYNVIPSLIESEKPDVVIFESVERFLSNAIYSPNPSCIK